MLTNSQLALPHGTKQKSNEGSKNKKIEMLRRNDLVMKSVSSVLRPQESLCWEGIVNEVDFEQGVKETGSCNVLLANIVKFTVISVIMQIPMSVPRTTEVVALTPTAATLQEATRAPVGQDTPGMESAVQVCT